MQVSTLLYLIAFVLFILHAVYLLKKPRRWGAFVLSMASGVGALFLTSYLLAQVGVFLAINYFTLLVSLGAGIPGVAGLLIFRFLAV